ncbi:MAG TPA: hypothetical protein VIX80_08580 [Candidatus Kapabacteria bacterium]
MRTYETNIVVNDPSQVVLTNIPFKKGETVHITIQNETEEMRLSRKAKAYEAWDKLSGLLGANDQFQELTEEEIAEEIAAYRRGE